MLCGRLSALIAVAALLACGSDSPGDPDPDAGVDAAPGPELVTVRVVSGSQPAAGIHVIFQDASGAVLDATVSGQGGVAQFDVPSGGMVTVAPPAAPLSTFSKVEPGDTLTFDVTPRGSPAGEARIRLPGPIATANRFQIFTGCGGPTLNNGDDMTTVVIDTTCVSAAGQIAVVAFAFEVDEGNNDAFVALHAVTAVRDQPISGGADIFLPAWRLAVDNFEMTLAGAIIPRSLLVGEVVDGVVFGRQFITGVNPVTIPVAKTISDSLQYTIGWNPPPIDLGARTLVRNQIDFFRIETAMSTQSYNTDTDGLAPITGLDLDLADLQHPVVSYSSTASEADMWVASIAWTSGMVGQTWDVIAPPGDVVTLPSLPDYLEDRWQPPSATAIAATAILAELSDADSYDEVRTGPGFSTYTSGRPPMAAPGSFVRASLGTLLPPASGRQPMSVRGWARLAIPSQAK